MFSERIINKYSFPLNLISENFKYQILSAMNDTSPQRREPTEAFALMTCAALRSLRQLFFSFFSVDEEEEKQDICEKELWQCNWKGVQQVSQG